MANYTSVDCLCFFDSDINCHIHSNVEVTIKTVNQLYNYSTVLEAAIKCKPYSEITVEIGTHLKTVKNYIEYICSVVNKRLSLSSTYIFNLKNKQVMV